MRWGVNLFPWWSLTNDDACSKNAWMLQGWESPCPSKVLSAILEASPGRKTGVGRGKLLPALVVASG